MKCLFPIGATLLILFAVCFVPPLNAQDTQETIDVDSVSRNFTVHLPTGYSRQQHYPAVILLHPQNQDADDVARLTHFNLLADKVGAIVIYPVALRGKWNIGVKSEEQSAFMPRRGYGRRGGWGGGGYPGGGYPGGGYPGRGQSGGENPNASRDRQVPLKYSVDTHRIYAAGLGEGGFMAERIGCDMADRIAAIAPVGAAYPKTMICLPSRPISALFISGTEDPLVPYDGGTYKPGHFHVLSAEDTAKTWAKFDHCSEKPKQAKIPAENGGKETKTYTYSGCGEGADVVLYGVKNGGNTWPGGEQYTSENEVGKTSNSIAANEVIWNFFSDRKLPANSGAK